MNCSNWLNMNLVNEFVFLKSNFPFGTILKIAESFITLIFSVTISDYSQTRGESDNHELPHTSKSTKP